jgi:hypothetical protein
MAKWSFKREKDGSWYVRVVVQDFLWKVEEWFRKNFGRREL